MPQVDVILFDIGNVLVRLKTEQLLARLHADNPKFTPEAYLAELRSPDSPHHAYERGTLSGQDFYAGLQQRFGLSWDYPTWLGLWNDYFETNRPMEVLLAKLQGQARFWGLSNTNAEHLAHLKLMYRLFDGFERIIASNEVGSRKPEPEIYDIAIRECGVPAGRILYLDDIGAYVDAGQARGLQGFHYTFNDMELKQKLLGLGFELPDFEGRPPAGVCA